MGRLRLTLISGTGLAKKDTFASDPYVILTLGGEKAVSAVKKNTLNPSWNQTFYFNNANEFSEIFIQVYDKDMLSRDDLMGTAVLKLNNVPFKKSANMWINLTPKGMLNVEVLAEDFGIGAMGTGQQQYGMPQQQQQAYMQAPPVQQQYYAPPQQPMQYGAPPAQYYPQQQPQQFAPAPPQQYPPGYNQYQQYPPSYM